MRALLLAVCLIAPVRADDYEPDGPLMPPAVPQDSDDLAEVDARNRDALEAGDQPEEDENVEVEPGRPQGGAPGAGAPRAAGGTTPDSTGGGWFNSAGGGYTPSTSGGTTTGTPAAPSAVKKTKAAAKSRGSSANKAASKMAQQMKAMTKSNADLAAGLGGAGKAADLLGGRGGLGPAGALKPGAPGVATPGEFLPAPGAPAAPGPSAGEISSWMGPYSDLLASRGLVADRAPDGSLRFRRKDGGPATKEEIAELKAAAEREPGALSKYPQFFQAISRSDYDSLRSEFSKNPDRPQFKDVGMTKDQRQDLVWSKSCDKLSGDCNKHAEEASYKKNDFVKPGSARMMWKSLLEAAGYGDEDEEETETAAAPGRARPTVPNEVLEGGDETAHLANQTVAAGATPVAAAKKAEAPQSAPARFLAKLPAMLGFGGGEEKGAKRAPIGWIIGLAGLAAALAARKLLA